MFALVIRKSSNEEFFPSGTATKRHSATLATPLYGTAWRACSPHHYARRTPQAYLWTSSKLQILVPPKNHRLKLLSSRDRLVYGTTSLIQALPEAYQKAEAHRTHDMIHEFQDPSLTSEQHNIFAGRRLDNFLKQTTQESGTQPWIFCAFRHFIQLTPARHSIWSLRRLFGTQEGCHAQVFSGSGNWDIVWCARLGGKGVGMGAAVDRVH